MPKQVDEGAAAADEYLASLQRQTDGEPPAEPTEPAPPQGADPAAPPAAPDPTAEIAAIRAELELERQRNRSLQGRLESQLKPANEELRELRKQLADMQKRLDQKDKGPAATRHLRPEEVGSVDQADLDRQARVARGVAEDVASDVLGQSQEAQQAQEERLKALEAAQAERAYDAMWDKVDRLSPGAREINETDAGWRAFLERVDPVSGRQYMEIGAAAVRTGDVRRIAQLVDEYRTAAGIAKPATPAAPVSPRVTTQVRPGASPARPAPAPANGPKPIYRRSQVTKFFTDYARGAFNGREAEAKQIEAALEAATIEGRVVPG